MKSLQRRFAEAEEKNPRWSTYLCFFEAIENQRFTRRTINSWFYRLVDKDDYFKADGMRELLHFLCKSSNPGKGGTLKARGLKKVPEEGMKQGVTCTSCELFLEKGVRVREQHSDTLKEKIS